MKVKEKTPIYNYTYTLRIILQLTLIFKFLEIKEIVLNLCIIFLEIKENDLELKEIIVYIQNVRNFSLSGNVAVRWACLQ